MTEQNTNQIDDDEKAAALGSLDYLIPDANNETAATENAMPSSAADNLYGLISLAPVALNVFGYKNTAAVFSAENNRALSDAFIPVFAKYSWGRTIIGFLENGSGGAEMALVAVVFPMALAVQNGVNLDKAEKSKQVENPVTVTDEIKPNDSGVFDVGSVLGSTFKYADQ